jgi:hypothetical protein
MVSTGYAAASQRQRDRVTVMMATATRMAQPTCTDGIAESWSASNPPAAE